MPEAVTVACGFCHKHFRCPPETRGRTVRCPFCETVVKVPASSEAGRQASQAIGDLVAAEKAARERVPLTARHTQVAAPPPGIRSPSLMIVWLVILGLGLIGIAIAFVWVCTHSPDQGEKTGVRKKVAAAPAPAAQGGAPSAPAPAPRLFSPGPAASGAAAPAASGAAAPAAPAAGGQGAPGAADVQQDRITVKVDRLLGGFGNGTITYAVGHVRNNGNILLKSVKIGVRITDREDKDLGEATAVVLNLPPGATAPLVAEWQHAEDVIGRRWYPAGYELNPLGVPQDLPQVEVREVLAVSDPNYAAATGKIRFEARTLGALTLPQVQVFAIILSPEGKIVGAAKGVLDAGLEPEKWKELMIPWTQCPNHLVHSAEVWVQAAL